ncbi:MAG TPA: AraC family transcriptional regulator [Lacunisphaera sp.]|jgi:AraC family transcriptional regulator|nr:AraC family transcriptional regulator [Lacunisphaera sp.]
MRCNTRTNWEFYAVIRGRCAPVFRDGEKPVLQQRTLWVFAPECGHAWVDDRRNKYHRISMHFGSVPYPLDEVVRRRGWIEHPLQDAEIVQLETIAAEIEPHYRNPHPLSPLLFERRLMDLALLALSGTDAALRPALPELANFKVENALTWYAANLAQRPSVKQVADAVHVSTSHLRRLFWQVRGTSPKVAFQRIRLEKAKELMSRSALTLEDVARHCGFANSSHLCREYRAFHDFTPTHWRKHLIHRFSKPFPPGVTFTRNFSARPYERLMPA